MGTRAPLSRLRIHQLTTVAQSLLATPAQFEPQPPAKLAASNCSENGTQTRRSHSRSISFRSSSLDSLSTFSPQRLPPRSGTAPIESASPLSLGRICLSPDRVPRSPSPRCLQDRRHKTPEPSAESDIRRE